MGWVYVVTHANAKGLFKIGITRNPANRTDQLGGDDLTIIAMLLNWNPERAEKRLHEKYKAVRVPQSEWFNLSKEDVEQITWDLASQHARVMAYVVDPTSEECPEEERLLIRQWVETCSDSGTWTSFESFKEEKALEPQEPHPLHINCFTGKPPTGRPMFEWNEARKMFCRIDYQ